MKACNYLCAVSIATLLMFVSPSCARGQNLQSDSAMYEWEDSVSNTIRMAKDSLRLQGVEVYQKYRYAAKRITPEKGEMRKCRMTHELLARTLLQALRPKVNLVQLPINYHLTCLTTSTNTKLFARYGMEVYILSEVSTSSTALAKYIHALKGCDYMIVDVPTEMPQTCYIFQYGDNLIMAIAPILISFADAKDDKIVDIAKEAVRRYSDQ